MSEVPTRRPRVVAVAIVPARRAHVIRQLARVVDAGGSALLVTADGRLPADLPEGIEAIDLVHGERRVGVHRLMPWRVWKPWRASRPYGALRSWVLWRSLHRSLAQVRVDEVDHVVIVALESWPIAWQLLHLQPAASYGWDVPDEVFERHGVIAPQAVDEAL